MSDIKTKDMPSYPFSGIATFLRAPYIDLNEDSNDEIIKNYKIGIMGIPFDEGCPFAPGSRFCAREIREQTLRFGKDGYYDHQLKQIMLKNEMKNGEIVDCGDVEIIPTDVDGNFSRITSMAKKIIESELILIALGGDHSISYPVVRAFHEPIHVIHLDAHADYLPISEGFENTNTHPFRHIGNMGHVKTLTQIGYRSIRETSGLDSVSDGNTVITMDDFRQYDPSDCFKRIPKGEACYVSIDIDVLDASLVPGCVSAEPDGMSYSELRELLRYVANTYDVRGFDMVEVCPPLDVPTNITSYLAAQIVVEFLGSICNAKF